MGKYSEEQFKNWYKPASETEDTKINNAIDMIKKALKDCNELNTLTYEVFVQGSYGNNTNVRVDSDVDVNVMLTSTFYSCYPDGKNDSYYGFSKGTISYNEYKEQVVRALKNKFGAENIELGNKSVKISSNSYRVDADCVISMQYRNYKTIESLDANKYVEGIKYFDLDGNVVINYPKEHISNGNNKNNNTNYEYKKLVRIFKRIRNKMCDDNVVEKDKITSFLVECLIWNVPNKTITGYSSWDETVKQAIIFLYNAVKEDKCSDWGEVSERLYLFHSGRKWTKSDVQNFLIKIWNYMGYGDENN